MLAYTIILPIVHFYSPTNFCGPMKLFPGPKEAQVTLPLLMASSPGTTLNNFEL